MPVLFSLAAVAVMAQAPQPVRDVSLGAPDKTLSIDFTQIRGVRELRDGRVLLTDRLDKGLVVADFTNNSSRVIGRTGQGPAEYRLPTWLTALPGDSTLLSDEGNSRMLVIGPDLTIRRTFMVQLPGLGTPLGARIIDDRGRYYLTIPYWIAARGPNGDSVSVVRFDPRTQRVDTIALIRGMTRRKNTMKPGMPMVPFTPQDVWTVNTAGRVAIVRSSNYHIEWHEPDGRVTRTPPVPFTPLPVSLEDKMAYTRDFMQNSSISGKGPGGSLGAMPPEMLTDAAIREVVDDGEFALTKGPFRDSPVYLTPEGTLWVERSVKPGDPSTWDVLDAAGKVIARVKLPKDRRIVAAGTGTIYLVVTTDDGFERLERYKRTGI